MTVVSTLTSKLTAVDESVNKLSRVVISVRPLYCPRLQEPRIWPTISFVQIHSSVWQMQLPWCPPCVYELWRASVCYSSRLTSHWISTLPLSSRNFDFIQKMINSIYFFLMCLQYSYFYSDYSQKTRSGDLLWSSHRKLCQAVLSETWRQCRRAQQ